jgi:hypothetical protein
MLRFSQFIVELMGKGKLDSARAKYHKKAEQKDGKKRRDADAARRGNQRKEPYTDKDEYQKRSAEINMDRADRLIQHRDEKKNFKKDMKAQRKRVKNVNTPGKSWGYEDGKGHQNRGHH